MAENPKPGPQGEGKKWTIQLDYREIDTSTSKGHKTLGSRTIVAADLFNSKDGSGNEIDKVEFMVVIDFADDSGSANGLDLSTATDNQHQMDISGNDVWEDIPFTFVGSKSGQHASGDMECVANGGGTIVFVADISALESGGGSTTLKEDALQEVVYRLQNAIALGDNLRLKVSSFVILYYNSKAND